MKKINKKASIILNKLNNKGFKAFVVGGCVRDSILGFEPKDWDITTNATPKQIKACFDGFKIIETGIDFGTVIVVIGKEEFEITTFRTDGKYTDNRKPDEVVFVNDIKEDLSRRDLTINAMAYNTINGLVDPFGGLNDLKSKVIRTVNNPDERFNEDGLRIMRAIRFAIRFGFDIETKTFDSIKRNVALLNNISRERINQEISSILKLKDISKLDLLHKTGILKIIIPELENSFKCEQNNPHHVYNVGKHIFASTKNIDNKLHLRLTMFLHDIGKPNTKTFDSTVKHDRFIGHPEVSANMTEKIMRNLKFDVVTIKKVVTLVKHHDIDFTSSEKSMRRLLSNIGEDTVKDLFDVRLADISAQNPILSKSKIDNINTAINVFNKVIADKNCFSKKDLKISGNDLIKNLNLKQGKVIGDLIQVLFDVVLDNPALNDKSTLINIAKKHIN